MKAYNINLSCYLSPQSFELEIGLVEVSAKGVYYYVRTLYRSDKVYNKNLLVGTPEYVRSIKHNAS